MISSRNARKIRQGIHYHELCIENPMFIEHARYVLTALGYEAWLRLMKSSGHSPVNGLPPI